MKVVKKTWGEEQWLVNNELYCAKFLICKQNRWSSNGKYHYHKNKDETFYILNGQLLLDVEGTEYILKQGDWYRIKPNTRHRFMAMSKLARLLETSTHHDDKDSYRTERL